MVGSVFHAPIDDDHINARLAADGILVISIPYPFAPTHPFPALLAAIASQMQKALPDSELPIDSSRFGLTGFSAGGNLALTVQQLAETPKVKAAVAFYPPVDFVISKEQRLEKRVPIFRLVIRRCLGEDWGENGRDDTVGSDEKTRWLRINGQKYSYTHDIPPITAKETVEAREERKRKNVEVLEDIGTWLMNGPFKK
ncbi:hypothetical protein EG329_009761 [Mollisiaceae sp. DMI_Dod_QoI]|nr:hypothetical protein EG329_009761 [Helotiales sp. DMI_Dod_QoI]